MSIRYEGAEAPHIHVEHVRDTELGEDHVSEALVLSYDEVFYITGTTEELRDFANRILVALDSDWED